MAQTMSSQPPIEKQNKQKTLIARTSVVGSMTLISRVLGFIRDIVIARFFGASLVADAFFVAFRIPNFFRRLSAEGAFSQAFVPVLSEYKQNKTPEEVQAFVQSTLGVLCLFLCLLTFVALLAAPLVILLFAPGFHASPEKLDLAISLLRITFPYLIFISLTAMAAAVLNTYGIFAAPAVTPVLLNIAMITSAILGSLYLEQPIYGLAWGVFAGGILQLVVQWPFLKRVGIAFLPRFKGRHAGVSKVLKLMLPALVGVSAVQISVLIDTLIASFLQSGSISWLYYSDRLMEFPLGVFGIALATVILPHLSQQHLDTKPEGFSHTLDWALKMILLIALPATLGLCLLAEPILISLFQYGAFDARDAEMSSKSLIAYSVGLQAFILIKVFATAFYARQDTKSPVRIALIALLANVLLNLALVGPLQHAGLALATSISAYLNASLLHRGLRKQGIYAPDSHLLGFFFKVTIANAVMAAIVLLMTEPAEVWLAWPLWQRGQELALVILSGAAAYALSLGILGLRPRHLLASS